MIAQQVLVYDQNADALAWRARVAQAAAGDRFAVVPVRSPTALLVLGQLLPEETPALVDLCDSDRDLVARPGERLVERLARHGVAAHAWTAHSSPDVIDGALACGARSVIIASATSDADRELRQLRAALSGETPEPAGHEPRAPLHWEAWFWERYGRRWQAWMEPVLVRLATTGEPGAHSKQLVEDGVVGSVSAGNARQRDLSQLIAGDRNRTPSTVARQATQILAVIGASRPLRERPGPQASILQAASALDEQPSLAVAAALAPHECRTLQSLVASVYDRRAREVRTAGAPVAGEIDDELLRAAGHLAQALNATTAAEVAMVARGLIAEALRAALGIAEAIDDALFAPEARAAAALLAAARLPEHRRPDGIDFATVLPTWQGLGPDELSLARDADPVQLRALTATVDAALSRR